MSRDSSIRLLAVAVLCAVLGAIVWSSWNGSRGEDPLGPTGDGADSGSAAGTPTGTPAGAQPTAESARRWLFTNPTPGVVSELTTEPHAILVRLQGRVRDAVTRRPVADAVISDGSLSESATDQDGSFHLEFVLDSSRRVIRASHAGYLDATRILWNRVVPGNGGVTGFDVELTPLGEAATVLGRVADANHRPVRDAKVELWPSPDTQMRSKVVAPAPSVTTGTDGSFVFAGLAPGRVHIRIAAEGFADHTLYDIDLPRGSRTDIGRILLEPYGWAALAGTIRNGRGEPIAGAEVFVLQREGKRARATSGSDGTYRIERVHPGRTYAGFELPDGCADFVQLTFLAARTTEHDFRVRSGPNTLGGRVLVGDSPAARFEVTAELSANAGTSSGSSEDDSSRWKTRTDGKGEFRIQNLPDGKFDLNFSREDPYLSLDARGIAGARADHVFRFAATAMVQVRGTVRDASGATLGGVSVAPRVPGGPASRAISAGDGTYGLRLPLTLDSTYLLVAEHSGFLASTVRVMKNMAADQGAITRDITLYRADATGTIEGTLTTSSGEPAGGVSIICVARAGRIRWRTWSDSRGRFRFASVLASELKLILSPGGGRPMTTQKIGTLERGGLLTPRIVLPDGRRFGRRVQVLGEAMQPVVGARVEAWTEGGMHLDDDRTSSRGIARLRDLPVGTARISISAERYPRQEVRHRVTGALAEPLVFRLRRGAGIIRGHVIGRRGKPREGVEISVVGRPLGDAQVHVITATDDAGRFAVELIPAGVYTVTTWTRKGSEKIEAKADGREIRIVID